MQLDNISWLLSASTLHLNMVTVGWLQKTNTPESNRSIHLSYAVYAYDPNYLYKVFLKMSLQMSQRWANRLLTLQKPFFCYLDVSVCNLVVVQVFEPLQDLPCVEADGGLIVFQWAPLGPQQCRQTPWTPGDKVQQSSIYSLSAEISSRGLRPLCTGLYYFSANHPSYL